MDSESSQNNATPPSRGIGLAVLAFVFVVVVWRALDVPVAPAKAAQTVDRLSALEAQRPRATARLSETHRRADFELSESVERSALSAFFSRNTTGAAAQRFELHRNSQRVSWWLPDSGQRWDFARNTLDPRRVRAHYSLDAEQVIVELSLSALLDEGLPAVWADATLGGLNTLEINALQASGETRQAFGYSFEALRAAWDDSALREVWWNAELGLALEWTRRTPQGEQCQRLEGLQLPGKSAELLAPHLRHPEWRQIDLADWREELSER